MAKPRARELGLPFDGEPGAANAITDVSGVLVGCATIIEGDGPLEVGRGPVRTGVTAILPRGRSTEMVPVRAGFHALNGNGELTGTHWIEHGGHFHGPVCLTNTHSVGAVHDAVTGWMIETYAREFAERHVWAMPVVGETYDGVLNDVNGRHVKERHVRQALRAASAGPVAEGNVGGGTGMIAYEFKGGTGTASRRVRVGDAAWTLGVLVQANHGVRDWLTVCGVPVGTPMPGDRLLDEERGSIVVVIATDAPLLAHQLKKVAQRATIGIGRGGTPGGNSSGDLFLAFSTAVDEPGPAGLATSAWLPDEALDAVYLATVRAVEEAVVNAMVAAEDMTTLKPPGKVCRAIDGARLAKIVRRVRAGAERG